MTSIPVNNSVKGIVPGTQTQKKSNTQDAAGSFSDIFKTRRTITAPMTERLFPQRRTGRKTGTQEFPQDSRRYRMP